MNRGAHAHVYSCLRVCFCSKQTFLFIVCTLTESNEPQLVRQVRPRWLLLSVCNMVKQQSLSLGDSKCGDIFRELPRYPWGRCQTLKCPAPIEGSWLILISVPYGHVFIVWSHILHALCVCNKHKNSHFLPWVLYSSKFLFLSDQWKNNYVLCQHTIWTFLPTHCTCYTQFTGIFFSFYCLDQKKIKALLQVSKVD